MSAGGSGGFDSRAWTGPENPPPQLDRGRARIAFAKAGGPPALRPQRVSSLVVAAGFALLVLATLFLPSVLDPWPLPASALDPLRGGSPMPWALTSTGIRALLFGLVILASLCGVALAWASRGALARGFEAAEGPGREAVFVTHRADLLAPVLSFGLLARAGEHPRVSLWLLLLTGFLALFLVRAMTAVAERRFAGLGTRSNRASRWDVVALGASFVLLTAMLVRLVWT